MSRIGRLPISVPAGVEVKVDGNLVTVKGPKGELSHKVASPITVALNENEIVVSRPNDERLSRSLHGLTRTLIQNLIYRRYLRLREEAGNRWYRLPCDPEGVTTWSRSGLLPPDQHHRSRGYYLRSGGC